MNNFDVYYAHHQWKYNTRVEEYELGVINRIYHNKAEIFNPSIDLKTDGLTEEEIMKECFRAIDNSKSVAFSSMDGVIGIGVYKEILYAREHSKPVVYIYHDSLFSHGWEIRRIYSPVSDRIYAYVSVVI